MAAAIAEAQEARSRRKMENLLNALEARSDDEAQQLARERLAKDSKD
jgi:hypothetical protein